MAQKLKFMLDVVSESADGKSVFATIKCKEDVFFSLIYRPTFYHIFCLKYEFEERDLCIITNVVHMCNVFLGCPIARFRIGVYPEQIQNEIFLFIYDFVKKIIRKSTLQ